MRRISFAELIAPFLVAGVVAYVFVRSHYGDLPTLQYVTPVLFGLLAFVEYAVSRRIRAAVQHEPDAKAIPAIFIARCVSLAKVSAVIGALLAGASAGLLAWATSRLSTIDAVRHDAAVALMMLIAGALLVVAALMLERSGIAPGPDDRTDPNKR